MDRAGQAVVIVTVRTAENVRAGNGGGAKSVNNAKVVVRSEKEKKGSNGVLKNANGRDEIENSNNNMVELGIGAIQAMRISHQRHHPVKMELVWGWMKNRNIPL